MGWLPLANFKKNDPWGETRAKVGPTQSSSSPNIYIYIYLYIYIIEGVDDLGTPIIQLHWAWSQFLGPRLLEIRDVSFYGGGLSWGCVLF